MLYIRRMIEIFKRTAIVCLYPTPKTGVIWSWASGK
jgi:hypothetical protein